MPTTVIGAVVAGIAAGSTIAGGVITFGFSWLSFAGSLIMGGLSKALAKTPQAPGSEGSAFNSAGRTFSVKQPASPWKVIVGESREGGVLTFAELHSLHNSKFSIVVTLACHECDAIGDIYIDDEVITPDMLGVDSGGIAGAVVSGRWSVPHTTPYTDTGTVPATPFEITLVNTIVSAVQSVSVQMTDDWGNEFTRVLNEGEGYTRSDRVITFAAEYEGAAYTVNYSNNTPNSYLHITKSLGNEGSAQPFPRLVTVSNGKWKSTSRQEGHTKIWLEFEASRLTSGLPNVSAVVRGLKVRDTRSGATAWSPSPVLALSAYFADDEWGLDADPDDEVDEATAEAAANVCEERVALAAGQTATFTASASADTLTLAADSRTPMTGAGVRVASSGALPTGLSAATTYYVIRVSELVLKLATSYANALAGTAIDLSSAGTGTLTLTYYDEQRYAVNGSFLTSERPGDIVERIVGSMAGRAAHISDRWWIHAGSYDTPTVTLDEDEFASGAVKIEPMPSREASANGVKGVFADPDKGWQATDFPALASSTYLAEDGDERIWADLDFSGFVRSHTLAQRLAKIELLRRRNGLTFSATFRLSAWRAMTARTISMTFARYGWTPKVFEVVESGFTVLETKDGPALGVQLSLRETAAAIYDWDTSEEQSLDLTPNTELPSVREQPAAPGAPSHTEEIYETTGSAGVKSRAVVTCAASDGPYVREHVLEWKRMDSTGGYNRASSPGPGAGQFTLDDLTPGYYLMRALAITQWGVESEQSATVVREIVGLRGEPADVSGFAVQSLAGVAKFVWDKATDLDVRIGGRTWIRWTPLTAGATWNDGTPVDPDGFPGSDTFALGPLQSGTYMAKFEDSSGNYSASAASFVITEALLVSLTSLDSVSFHPSFAGTKTNTGVLSSALQLVPTTLWDDMPGNIDDWGLIDYIGGVPASGSCLFSSRMDLGSVQNARLFTTIESQAFDTSDVWDSRTTFIDTWGLVDGSVIEDAEVELMVRKTDDDPASGGASWGPWHPLGLVADYNARGFDFRADFTSGNPTHNRQVTELTVTAKQ